MDAPAPARRPTQTGRPRTQGRQLPTLHQGANDRATRWQPVTVRGWYGARARRVARVSGTCVWEHTGIPAVPLRWGLSRAPQGTWDMPALRCTQWAAPPVQVLAWGGRRGHVAVTCEEARAPLGLATQRPWSEQAVPRTTPWVLGL